MSLGKVGDARRVFYSLRLGSGAPATGVAIVDMAVTIDDPSATATSSPAPVEIGGGRYYFDIPGAFSTANGPGTYGGNVVVSSVAPRVVDVVPFEVDYFVNDVDDTAADLALVLAGLVAINADTDDIQTRLPATLTGGRMRSHVEALDAGVIDAVAAPNLDVAVSTRSDFDETTDPVELLDAGGAAGTSAAELVADIDAALVLAHGGGPWITAVGFSTLTAAQVWQYDVSANFDGVADRAQAGGAMRWLRMLSVNRQEMSFGPDRQNVYDDAGAVIVSFAPLADASGSVLTVLVGAPARRTGAFS